MNPTVLAITYFIVFIPSIFLFYFILQSFNWEKSLKAGKVQYFKVFYILLCIILACLLAFSITYTMDKLSEAIMR